VRIHGVVVLPDPADDQPEVDETAVFAGTIKAWSGTPVQVAVRLSARVIFLALMPPGVLYRGRGNRAHGRPMFLP